MIHLLVVDPDPLREFDLPPSFELLRAHGAEEAAEKLSRNRRIDAVLFLEEDLARHTAGLIRQEDPLAPPLFLAGEARVPGVTPLGPGEPFAALAALLGEG